MEIKSITIEAAYVPAIVMKSHALMPFTRPHLVDGNKTPADETTFVVISSPYYTVVRSTFEDCGWIGGLGVLSDVVVWTWTGAVTNKSSSTTNTTAVHRGDGVRDGEKTALAPFQVKVSLRI